MRFNLEAFKNLRAVGSIDKAKVSQWIQTNVYRGQPPVSGLTLDATQSMEIGLTIFGGVNHHEITIEDTISNILVDTNFMEFLLACIKIGQPIEKIFFDHTNFLDEDITRIVDYLNNHYNRGELVLSIEHIIENNINSRVIKEQIALLERKLEEVGLNKLGKKLGDDNVVTVSILDRFNNGISPTLRELKDVLESICYHVYTIGITDNQKLEYNSRTYQCDGGALIECKNIFCHLSIRDIKSLASAIKEDIIREQVQSALALDQASVDSEGGAYIPYKIAEIMHTHAVVGVTDSIADFFGITKVNDVAGKTYLDSMKSQDKNGNIRSKVLQVYIESFLESEDGVNRFVDHLIYALCVLRMEEADGVGEYKQHQHYGTIMTKLVELKADDISDSVSSVINPAMPSKEESFRNCSKYKESVLRFLFCKMEENDDLINPLRRNPEEILKKFLIMYLAEQGLLEGIQGEDVVETLQTDFLEFWVRMGASETEEEIQERIALEDASLDEAREAYAKSVDGLEHNDALPLAGALISELAY